MAPGSASKGGITAVVQNYKKSDFWKNNHCFEFSSSIDEAGAFAKFAYLVFRYPAFIIMLLREQPNVVSLHTAHQNSFYRKFLYLILARVFGVRVILHIHPASFLDFYNDGNRIVRKLVRLAFRLSDRIVFLSENIRQGFSGLISDGRSFVLGNPVDIGEFTGWRQEWQKKPRQILYLGWIIQEKGVYDIVDALPKVLGEFPDAKVLFAGNKEVEKLSNYIGNRKLSSSAIVLGWIEGMERIELLRTSRALILPSYTEGVPNVLLEAMASRLPIITSAVGGIPGLLEHDHTGIFIEPGNTEQIAEAIKLLIADEAKCDSLSDAAYKEVVSKYSLEVIGRQLERLYEGY